MADQPQTQLQDEAAWVVLLQASQQLEQQLICKLLCCSRDMAQLVHSACADRVKVVLPPAGTSAPASPSALPSEDVSPAAATPTPSASTAELSSASNAGAAPTAMAAGTEAMTAWLTKYLHLVGSLTVDLAQIDEAAVAAAMQAAGAATAGRSAAAAGSDSAAAGNTLDRVRTRMEATSVVEQQPAQHGALSVAFLAPDGASQGAQPSKAANSSSSQLGGPVPSLGPNAIQLSELVLQGECRGSILSAVSGNTHLTRLDLCFTLTPMRFSSSEEAAAVAALGSLRSLRDLKLGVRSVQEQMSQSAQGQGVEPFLSRLPAFLEQAAGRKLAPLLPALQHLTQLHSLVLTPGCLTQRTCALLPPSLRQLTIDRLRLDAAAQHAAQEPEDDSCPLLNLAPLTTVTQLYLLPTSPGVAPPSGLAGPGSIIAGDVLPPRLQQLQCLCTSLAPVLALGELRDLHMGCTAVLAQLPDLAAMTALSSVTLLVNGSQKPIPEAAAAAVGKLPIKDLTISVGPPMSAAALQHVPSWGRAHSLELQFRPSSQPTAVLGLVSQLQKVPKQADGSIISIKRSLAAAAGWRARLNGQADHAWSKQDALQLCQQLSQVKYVDGLDIRDMPLGAAAGQLAGATHLKRLSLVGCGVPAGTASALREQLHGAEVDISETASEAAAS